MYTTAYYVAVNKRPEFRQALAELLRKVQPLLPEHAAPPPADANDPVGSAAHAALEAFILCWKLPDFDVTRRDLWRSLRTAARQGRPPGLIAVRSYWTPTVGTPRVGETEPDGDSDDGAGAILLRERVPAIWPPQLAPLPYDPTRHTSAQREALRKRWHRELDECFDEQARALERAAEQAGYERLPGNYYKYLVDTGPGRGNIDLEVFASRLYRRAVLLHAWKRIAADDTVGKGTVRRQVDHWAQVLNVLLPVVAAGRPRPR